MGKPSHRFHEIAWPGMPGHKLLYPQWNRNAIIPY
jgi:hypothetical protein